MSDDTTRKAYVAAREAHRDLQQALEVHMEGGCEEGCTLRGYDLRSFGLVPRYYAACAEGHRLLHATHEAGRNRRDAWLAVRGLTRAAYSRRMHFRPIEEAPDE